MFPFQRSASYLTFVVYDFELLDALRIFCFGEYNNCPKRRFLTWTTMRISDGRTNVILQDAGIGFILVIDRRQDKWTSVKASILRIA
uniref:Uncharacterized protein n=1 Tax=Gopherus evgoodei TaxID=1825980 RepID=A0A8C5EX88_9SAUR